MGMEEFGRGCEMEFEVRRHGNKDWGLAGWADVPRIERIYHLIGGSYGDTLGPS